MKIHAIKSLVVPFSIALAFCGVVGCEPAAPPAKQATQADDHDHAEEGHAHPETLADAVKQLEGVAGTIKAAFAKDDAEAAHEPLHDVGHLLEQVPDLIKKSSLDDATKAEVQKASDTLFESYSAVDEGMHGSGGKKYSEVSDTIDGALKVLAEKAK